MIASGIPPESTVFPASIAGRPVHPKLVSFPIAFFVATFACDLVFWRNGNPGVATSSAMAASMMTTTSAGGGYAFAPFDYVNAQHHDFIRLLTSMGVDKSGPFLAADFTAPFLAIGAPLTESGATVVRIVAAALTLATVIWFDRQAEGKLTTLAIFLAAAIYMTVFNPRVESNTYIMLAVPAAIAIAYLWREDQGGARRVVLSVAIFLCGLSGVERHLHDFLNLWFRPLAMTLISLPLLWWLWGKVHVKTTGFACG